MIDNFYVTGVTTNPTIFAAALTHGDRLRRPASPALSDVDEAITASSTTTDVRDACDLFAGTYDATDGFDGRVSIEVAPTLAYDTEATIVQAARSCTRRSAGPMS
jgi:transaldolase